MSDLPLDRRVRDALRPHISRDPEAIGASAAAPGAHVMVWRNGELECDVCMGYAQLVGGERAMPDEPVFDLASVTKAIVPATLLMQAVDEGRVSMDTPVSDVMPEWRGAPGGDNHATMLQLANHSSGLPAWHRYYDAFSYDVTPERFLTQRDAIRAQVMRTPRRGRGGRAYTYSDLGYIVLAWALERVLSGEERSISELARQRIFEPLGMESARYVDFIAGDAALRDAVATEDCPLRGRVLVGEVHDDNTSVMGGVSGHAGCFATARDVGKFAEHIRRVDCGDPGIVSQRVLQFCWSEAARGAHGHHLGGWDTPSGPRTSVGRGFGKRSTVGHLGFTGTSVWVERALGVVAVALTNRVHPTRENPRILELRIDVHEAACPPA
ncbi:MAG: serine hydrolase domain-containing protein [Myxococcota bacterium]